MILSKRHDLRERIIFRSNMFGIFQIDYRSLVQI